MTDNYSNESNYIANSNFFGEHISKSKNETDIPKNIKYDLYSSFDFIEDYILQIKNSHDHLQNLFSILEFKGDNISVKDKNTTIEQIIYEVKNIKNLNNDLNKTLDVDLSAVKGLQVMNTTNLNAFDSIFDDI